MLHSRDVAGDYVHMASDPAQVRHLVDRALRIAMAERPVTYIIMPNDIQESPAVEKPPRAHGTIHSGVGYTAPRIVPAEADLRRADRPGVIDAVTDPNVPPLPPHIKIEQAKGYAEAVLRGDPDALKIIWQSGRKGVKGVLPGT